MLIKKKFFNSNYLLFIKSLFSKFLFVLGFIFLTLIISVFIYYFSSGLSKSYSPKILIIKVNEKILDKYIPEFPEEVQLKLPKLKKVGNKTELPKIKLPKLKKV